MKTSKKEQVLTIDLRSILKSIMQSEVEKLPETLSQLEAKDRINIVCKLMPFVFPKVETISPLEGEPLQW